MLLVGCGGSKAAHAPRRSSASAGLGPPIRIANCSDWEKGSVDDRHRFVIELRNFAGGPVGSSQGIQNGPVLDDVKAYRLLDSYCRNYFARGFKLYKLYDRAAAFIGHSRR